MKGFRDFLVRKRFLVKWRSLKQNYQLRDLQGVHGYGPKEDTDKSVSGRGSDFDRHLGFRRPPGGPTPGMPPHHGMFPLMGLSGLSGNQQQLYVLAGGKIMQYSLADLKLLKTVDLPKPKPPADLKAKGKEERGKCPPPPHPPMAGPQGFWVGDGALYVLAGPMLYKFSLPDLTLKTKAELPKPEFPKAAH